MVPRVSAFFLTHTLSLRLLTSSLFPNLAITAPAPKLHQENGGGVCVVLVQTK